MVDIPRVAEPREVPCHIYVVPKELKEEKKWVLY
jgi:hypothetical protein